MTEKLSKEERITLKIDRFRKNFANALQVSRPDEFNVKMNNLLLTLADYIFETVSPEEDLPNEK